MTSPSTEAVNPDRAVQAARPRRRIVRWSELIGPVGYWKIGILAALLVAIYYQELSRLVHMWLNDGDWSHGLLVPVYSLYFLNSRRQVLLGVKPKGSYLGLAVLLLAYVLFFFSVAPPSIGYLRSLSLVTALFGVVLLVGGPQVMKAAWFPILFLMFALPLPGSVMFQLTYPLRHVASQVAALVLEVFTSAHAHAEGVVIVVDHGTEFFKLNVERACAGMRLMMAFFALGTAIAFLDVRPVWHRIIMLASCLPIALFCNIFRVTTTSLIHVFIGREYASGSAHTILGLSMLLLAFGLFFGVRFILDNLYVEEEEPAEGTSAGPAA